MARPVDLLGVQERPLGPGWSSFEAYTSTGTIIGLLHDRPEGDPPDRGVIYLGGAIGGLSGPGHASYERWAIDHGGLRLHYRRPGSFDDCVLDVLVARELLAERGVERVALVGHSFGAAVAITAGVVLGERTLGVAALSTQLAGTEPVELLGGAPLLLVHGDRDEVLAHQASEIVFQHAADPKELVLLAGEGHGLTGADDALDHHVGGFLDRVLAP